MFKLFLYITLLLSLVFATRVNPGNASSTMDNQTQYVVFETKVLADQVTLGNQYYATLSDLVVNQPGFISQTPFVSVNQATGQVLYVKFDNAEHLRAWKNLPVHLRIQATARAQIFYDYRLRIGREYHHGHATTTKQPENDQTASAGKYFLIYKYPTPSNNNLTAVTQTYTDGAHAADLGFDIWRSVVDAATYISGTETLRISSWQTAEIALQVKNAIPRVEGDEIRLIRVERDYGKFHRGEAPKDADVCQAAALRDDTKELEQC